MKPGNGVSVPRGVRAIERFGEGLGVERDVGIKHVVFSGGRCRQ